LELPNDYPCAILMLLLSVSQIVVLKSQKEFGPRWFVPRKFRRDPNAYEYNRDLDSDTIQQEESGQVEEMVCVICMVPVRHDVDMFGGVHYWNS